MAQKKRGSQTVVFNNPPSIIAAASIAGSREGRGPLTGCFDTILEDDLWGEKTWEKAESKMVREVLAKLLSNASKTPDQVDYIISGDLLNQCIASSFGVRESGIPFFGVFGACSTMAESLSLGAMLVDGGYADCTACITSSHFCSAERQFRYPLELGSIRPPTAQWTVTGSGGVMLGAEGTGPFVTHVTTGKITDYGIKDSNNMGAAMAPAAADVIFSHFQDTGMIPADYDLILTGDLASVGREICAGMLADQGVRIDREYNDCGMMVFDMQEEDVHAGGSGCGCSALVLAGYVIPGLRSGKFNKVLFVSTGALLSPTSVQQGESIPSIAHAITLSRSLQ